MLITLALRNLVLRPWRSLLLLAGFGLGVGVMITLLSIGEAMVIQSRDEKLVGGGEVTVLPDGVDLEVLKTGGVGGLWFSVANARFVYLQLLASPRLAPLVHAAAPQIEGKLLYLRSPRTGEVAVRGGGEIPSRSRAVGGAPTLVAGTWEDDDGDRRWASPNDAQLRHDIDRFHETPATVGQPASWAEWHYFNVLSPDRKRWAFLTFMVGGEVPRGDWGGQLLLTLHEEGKPAQRFSRMVERARVRYSTTDADLRLDDASVRVLPDGRYAVRARVPAETGGAAADVDLIVAPAPRAYFPGTSLGSGNFVSGYVVAGLRASATGTLCVGGRCERFDGAQAYHDHNWGTWQGVTWDWGAARAGGYTLLYGRVQAPDSLVADAPLFLYLVDSLGFRAVFRPRQVQYVDGRTIATPGGPLRVPSRAVMLDARGGDTLRVELEIEDAVATDTRATTAERGETGLARRLPRPWFVQMKGIARLSGRVDGARVAGEGTGFFETYR
ncbi:MAG TPA: hypothetical protein VFV33_07530 [Gemmatimonadaceae bacterium]|nr:hypothetical protein [Gemmatimonadaceae bacterium]